MNISDVAIKRHVFTWMLMASLILFGTLSFREMGISMLPDVDSPVVSISINLEGASPEVMESQIIDQVESALLSVQGIKGMNSSAKQGKADVTVEFDLSKDINVAVQEVQTVLAQTQRKLPNEIDPPVVRKRNPEDRPILWISISSKNFNRRQLMGFVRDEFKDHFATIDGVAEVSLGGFVDPTLRVWLSLDKLKQYDLTVDDIKNTIQREHNELPAGRIEMLETEKSIRIMGEASTIEEFKNLVINKRDGSPNFKPIFLKDIATIEDSLDDIRRISRTNLIPSVGVGIIKERGSNAVAVADQVKEKMEEIKPLLPEGVDLSINYDSTKFIKESVHELIFTLFLSALLTALVCWFFLGSLSATINVILAIPTSIVGSFIVLNFLDFTLNTFTILGLSLSIGIVVDDAIMVLENIVRHKEGGKTKLDSALIGTREIAFAALAATVAIVAIFLPVAFMKGVIGRYFFQFGVTISVAVLLSLLEALTLTPMRCSQFLNTGERTTKIGRSVEKLFHTLANFYKGLLPKIIAHPWKVVTSCALFFLASLVLLKTLNQEFVPAQDQGLLMLRLKTKTDASLAYTDEKMKTVEDILKSDPTIQRFFVSLGGFGGGVNSGMAFITLKNLKEREINPQTKTHFTQQEYIPYLRKKFKSISDTKIFIQDPSQGVIGGRRGYPIEFSLRGPSWEKLIQYSDQMVHEMEKFTELADISSDYEEGSPEIQVIPDRVLASRYGVSVSDISQTLNTLIAGTVAGFYTKNGKRSDIKVQLRESERNKIEDINQLVVRNNRGELIPLSHVIKITEKSRPQTISRTDRSRAIGITSNISQGASQSEIIKKIQDLAAKILPPEYHIVVSGSSKEFKESFSSLFFAFILGLVIAYMVLASQFNSFIHPFTVLVALPFSISGALIALAIGNQSINIYSMIGFILLMGIVKKNSILLVDFTNQYKEKGLSAKQALIESCPLRLRPILMTSFSTIAAAIPSALNLGPGAETRIPMALAVIGGVLISTLLTLAVVPCVYVLFSKKQNR